MCEMMLLGKGKKSSGWWNEISELTLKREGSVCISLAEHGGWCREEYRRANYVVKGTVRRSIKRQKKIEWRNNCFTKP